jgi:hypothetical protein
MPRRRVKREALVDTDLLTMETITVDGTTINIDDLAMDSTAPEAALADWRAAGARYEAAKAISPGQLTAA